jgi:hypothetical protein
MIKSILSIAGFSMLLFAIHFFAFWLIGYEFRPVLGFIYVYMAILTVFFERVLVQKSNAKQFIVVYMGFSGGKMFLSLFVLLIYIFYNGDYMIPFAFTFLLLYFSFSGLEIVRLLRYFKK